MHDCVQSQRCDNTIGSFNCVRFTSCGTGYTLNAATGTCEGKSSEDRGRISMVVFFFSDDDECVLGTHDCAILGPSFQCRNTLGSFRCEKKRCTSQNCVTVSRTYYTLPAIVYKTPRPVETQTMTSVKVKNCLPGFVMGSDGNCDDIDECQIPTSCMRHQKCVNTVGSYYCLTLINCKPGFKISDDGRFCEDVNECETGTHKCGPQQQCINREGYHICQCPVGYKAGRDYQCEDINECDYYRGQQVIINDVRDGREEMFLIIRS